MKNDYSPEELRQIGHAIARLRASVMAVTFGLSAGIGLLVATLWLIVRGPAPGRTEIGPTLALLSNYFPGYEVTVLGSIIGFFYAAVCGAISGWLIAFIYNLIAGKMHGPLV